MNLYRITPLLLGIGFLACSSDDGPAGAAPTTAVSAPSTTIFLHQEYSSGVGGLVVIEYRPYLMFPDGDVYRNLATSVDKLDEATSKASEPKEWGTWQQSGTAIDLRWSDGETERWEDKEWFRADPASVDERIAGSYSSISGGGNTAFGGDILTFSSANLAFEGDRFTFERTSGGMSSNVTAYASQDRAGTYRLDGHTIELRFNSGKVEKKFFYFYPEVKDVFGVADDYYVAD